MGLMWAVMAWVVEISMSRLFRCIAILIGIVMPHGLFGQSLTDEINFKSGNLGGVRLYGISVYSGYSTSAYPLSSGLTNAALPGAGTLDPDVNYGAQATLGCQVHGQRTGFSAMYSGGYGGMVRYSGTNGLSQNLSLSLTRQLS